MIDRSSIRFKIVMPVILVITSLFLFVSFLNKSAVDSVVDEYRILFVQRHSFEIKKIFERALNQLSTTQLIGNEVVVSAKKTEVIEEIRLYWLNNRYEGFIREGDKVVVSTLKGIPQETILSGLKTRDSMLFEHNNNKLVAFSVAFPAWDYQVITVAEPEISESEKNLRLLLPLILIGFMGIIGLIFYILHTRLGRSINSMISAIKGSKRVPEIGMTELDTIGTAVNDAFARLERFKLIIESSSEIIYFTDEQGNIVYVNPAFETVTGYQKEDVIGRNPRLLKSGIHDEGFYRNLWSAIKGGKRWYGEITNKKKDGEVFYVSSAIFPIYFEKDLCFVAIQRDVTSEKRLYEQLLRAQKMEAIGTLAGGIAHDFNNILTAISGYSEIMLGKIDENDRFYKPVRVINDAAKRAADLTMRLLTITRKEKQKVKTVNINAIAADVVDILRHSVPKNIEIVARLDDSLPDISADPSQIHQVMLNLSVNARDAMPEGGVLTITTSQVGAGAAGVSDGHFIKVSVSDTGTGISSEIQQKVFDPFFTTKGVGKGTGLGLYIVHSIVASHNGYINLYSEPGKGTRFNIYLPVTRSHKDAEDEPIEGFKGQGLVLVIDDEEDVRSICGDMLQNMGFSVIAASDGKEGIQKYIANKEAIRLVILDMIMPRMGGEEVFMALKDINPGVKVIICSGFSHDGYAGIDRLIQEGATGFLQKPYSMVSISAAIRKAFKGIALSE